MHGMVPGEGVGSRGCKGYVADTTGGLMETVVNVGDLMHDAGFGSEIPIEDGMRVVFASYCGQECKV